MAAILAIYFLSGACSLMDEVVWVRLLKLTLGNTVFASSIVVSVFMGGLALGALVMSRWADRVQNQLRLYAILEALVTVTALALPWALRLADRGYVAFFQAVGEKRGRSSLSLSRPMAEKELRPLSLCPFLSAGGGFIWC